MFEFLSFLAIFGEEWFLQGIFINASFAVVSIPFTRRIFQNIFKNRKKDKIKKAGNELKIYCLQKLIGEKYIDKNEFENQLFLIANKYELNKEDIYANKNVFIKELMISIIDTNLIDANTKEKIANKIRHDQIFIRAKHKNIIDEKGNTIFVENSTSSSDKANKCNIKFASEEKKKIFKYTLVATIVIFIFLLSFISIVQVLFRTYGINAVIFMNTIVIMVTIIPILMNGVIHFEKFNKQNRKIFYLLLAILMLNFISFICIVSILMV